MCEVGWDMFDRCRLSDLWNGWRLLEEGGGRTV